MTNFMVKSCRQCPFANRDNEYGYDMCNHPHNLGKVEAPKYETFWELPVEGVHKNCPLRYEAITLHLCTKD